ncbi:MAG: type VI secretion system baseplate subunit TssK, partial [Paracoccaceae bacterium]|nr:type VI secretion system baseplate subunit TssK [Paracoccaceae bacterium]
MADSNKVVWSEGLFLRTQHFQQQDRYAESLLRGALLAAPLQAYGFSSLELDQAALDAGRLSIATAAGLFPDGTPFSIPDGMVAPASIAVKGDGSAGIVSIAIPAEQRGSASIDPAHGEPSGARYRGRLTSVRDAVRGGADAEEIEVADLSARLIGPGETTAGFTVLPLARIDGLRADGSV